MIASSTRSLRATVAGVAGLAVVGVLAIGYAAGPPAADDMEAPVSAPDADRPDETGQPDGSEDDTAGNTPTPSAPRSTDGTTRPSNPDTEPTSTAPTTKPPAKPTATPVTRPAAEPAPTPVAKPTPTPVAKPAPTPVAKPAAIADGGHAGRLVSITTEDVTVALVRVLSGAEAIAAAKADGGDALDDNGTLPNDIYIQDLKRTVTIPVAGDAGVRIYDCSGGCELVGTTLTALASGQVVPSGGPNAVINLTVEQGVVVSFEEQYLP